MNIKITGIDPTQCASFTTRARKGEVICFFGHYLQAANDVIINEDGELEQEYKYLGKDYRFPFEDDCK